VDQASHPWFDVKTGRPNIWHSPGENSALDFFNGPGFHPKTGKALTEITQDFADKLLRDKKEKADALARAEAEEEARIARAKAEEEARMFAASCNELAGNPNDQRRRSNGVSYDQLRTQVPEAIRVCNLAVQQFPKDLTLQYQLARAVELVDPARGQAMQDRLVKFGYPAAFDNAGSLLLNEKGCRQHCINEAVKLFRKGAALGDPDAMMSLADQIGQNHATGDQISLHQRAAKQGHPGAKKALDALAEERAPPRLIYRSPF
jgi:TPR repeat protein